MECKQTDIALDKSYINKVLAEVLGVAHVVSLENIIFKFRNLKNFFLASQPQGTRCLL